MLRLWFDITFDYYIWYYIMICNRFCWSSSFLQAVPILIFCASFAVSSLKVQYCKRTIWSFHISGHRTEINIKSGKDSLYHENAQDVNDLRQHVIDVWDGVEHSVIDDTIDQWRRLLWLLCPTRVGCPVFLTHGVYISMHAFYTYARWRKTWKYIF